MTERLPAGERPFLAIDTATRTAVVALGAPDGQVIAEERWASGHRHGSELLTRIEALLAANATTLRDIGGVAVGVGPGSFTGLRVGLAAAKVIAYSLDVPIVAISSLEAIAFGGLEPGVERVAVLLPAGTTDRYLGVVGLNGDGRPELVEAPRLVAGATDPEIADGTRLLAVDLAPDAVPADALAAGAAAIERLAAGLVALGAAARMAGATTGVAELVPAYVALPRGVLESASGITWSPDLR
jgi:tRNA threonylcarbamoyladenosine biosynthesis protein TsaB